MCLPGCVVLCAGVEYNYECFMRCVSIFGGFGDGVFRGTYGVVHEFSTVLGIIS